jgi:type II secretory ATPase GspE/PulE/Tfp pilus assembly ATPase PilB-like protein
VGRTAVSEVLTVDTELRELIADGATEAQLARAARAAGMSSLREEALALASAGEVAYAEVLRATPVPSAPPAPERRVEGVRATG